MPANRPIHLRATGLLAGALLALSGLAAAADSSSPPATDKDAFPTFDNYITFTGQNAWVTGNSAAFQSETKSAKNGTGGIEDFQYNKDLTKDVSVKSDGHALAGAEDYLAHFNIARDDVGSFDAGYKRFRTFDDGIGGFFPTNNAWMPVIQQNLYVDRAKLWAEGTINLPDKPVITLRYTNELRDGRKDSTIWGATDLTGIPVLSNASTAARALVPSYINLGERHQIIEALARHTVGKTTYEVSLVADVVNNLDTRYFERYPGELKPFPAIPATPVKVIPSTAANNQITGFDQEGVSSNTFSATGRTETVISDKLSFHTGVRYQHLTSSFTGYRPLYTSTATGVGVVIAPSANFQNLTGGSKVLDYTANAGVELKPVSDLFVSVDVRGENRFTKAADSFNSVAATVSTTTGAVTTTPTANHANSTVNEPSWIPSIDLRYTGIRDISFYASGDYRYSSGTERLVPQFTTTPVTENEDVHENHGRYTVGANWAPVTFFSLRGETFYKDHQNNFQDYASASPTGFVLGYQLYGGRLSAVVSPLPTLSCTTSYVLQRGKMETAANLLATYDSMDARSQQIGETVDWTPIRQFYLQAGFNLVFDTTRTGYPQAGGVADNTVQNSNNNYWDANGLAGYALDPATDVEAEFVYYRADNYQPALAGSVSYGAGARDYRATLGVKRKLTEHLIASAKFGYLVSRNDTTGNFTNYTARVAYLSLERAF